MDAANAGPVDQVVAVRRVDAETIEVVVRKDGCTYSSIQRRTFGWPDAVMTPAAFDALDAQLRARVGRSV